MTITEASSSMPRYSSVLACLPEGEPIPLVKVLAAYDCHDRQMAAVLVVSQTWADVERGLETLPCGVLLNGLRYLCSSEQRRVVELLIVFLSQASATELRRLHALPAELKQAAWKQLPTGQQERLRELMGRRMHR